MEGYRSKKKQSDHCDSAVRNQNGVGLQNGHTKDESSDVAQQLSVVDWFLACGSS
ncbi:hypothetical protein GCM10027403_20000 [Arthrobacter tecti]